MPRGARGLRRSRDLGHLFSTGPAHVLPLVTSLVQKIRRIGFYENDRTKDSPGERYVVRPLG